MTAMVEMRLRTQIPDTELTAKLGKIVTDGDYNALITGPARLLRPDGALLAVYLPDALADDLEPVWPILRGIRLPTDNRGLASGTPRAKRGDQSRTRTRNILSGTLGSVDPGPSSSKAGRLPACRQTAWTGQHPGEWQQLHPLLQAIDGLYRQHVPRRWAIQASHASVTNPAWVIPGTVFTTLTVNNTYSTGVHLDAGDLKTGFSTLATARTGAYRGGHLVFPRYRVAVDMHHGDLLLFDPHEYHGNTAMTCDHQEGQLARPCPAGCERVSLVAYYRTKVQQCASPEEEHAKALASGQSEEPLNTRT